MELDQTIFKGLRQSIVVACVDYDGLLKFGDSACIRYTWASERWRGANWLKEIPNTQYEPLTRITRKLPKGIETSKDNQLTTQPKGE